MDYRHTQNGYTAVLVLGGFLLVFLAVLSAADEDPAVLYAAGGLLALFAVVVVTFNRLTVAVGAGRVLVAFGWGWPRRTIEVLDISGFRRVRNKWYYGWGIRKVPGGWMYNVWGLDAVEIDLRTGKKFRIGTDEPSELAAALSLHTSLRPSDPS